MKKIKKIKIKLNGKILSIEDNLNLLNYVKRLKVPLKKVAIELNHKIMDKSKLKKVKLK